MLLWSWLSRQQLGQPGVVADDVFVHRTEQMHQPAEDEQTQVVPRS